MDDTMTMTDRLTYSFIKMLINDVLEFVNGDEARFSRKVDNKGKGVGDLKTWKQNIVNGFMSLPDCEQVNNLLIFYIGELKK